MSLVTRNTLKVLKIRTDLKAEIADPPPEKKNSSTRDKLTTTASNKFILSLRYSPIPNANIFIPISIVKIIVKVKLN